MASLKLEIRLCYGSKQDLQKDGNENLSDIPENFRNMLR